MSKWTPGPWVVGSNLNGTNYNANTVYSPRSEAHMDVGIAQVYGIPMHRGLHEIEDCEGLANAHLIAAAPEMAELLAEFVGMEHLTQESAQFHQAAYKASALLERINK